MHTRRFYFLSKKFSRIASDLLISFTIGAVIFTIYSFFQTPIKEQLNIHSPNYNLDYKIMEKKQNVLGKSSDVKSDNLFTEFSINTYNYRARVFDLYFKQNNSPLYGWGESFSAACDKYGAPHDCTLLPAIAKVETNLCKTGISESQHNCWGFGGSGSNRIVYENFDQAVDEITRRLMIGYTSRFFEDPEYGELTYCGAHCYTWGDKVKSSQNEIKNFAQINGYEL